MRALRLILAGLVALVAVMGGLVVAAVVVLTGLAAYLLHFFVPRPKPQSSGPPSTPRRPPNLRTDDAIDVIATKVPSDPSEH